MILKMAANAPVFVALLVNITTWTLCLLLSRILIGILYVSPLKIYPYSQQVSAPWFHIMSKVPGRRDSLASAAARLSEHVDFSLHATFPFVSSRLPQVPPVSVYCSLVSYKSRDTNDGHKVKEVVVGCVVVWWYAQRHTDSLLGILPLFTFVSIFGFS